ncbi:MAG: ferrous iron transport protein A [Gemmataceae bacterium]|nr:ferrous iron transport protein A [Gemmataceae bacterium]MCI0738172.1 ferrous iron transport protein A [Gemmataceae bacterium]
MPTLDQLKLGDCGCILAIQGEDALVQRLYEMGFLEGEQIEVLGFAPLGDPMEILLRDYRLSLRRSEAARIFVRHPVPTSARRSSEGDA